MPTCDLCGVEDTLLHAIVEGTILNVCKRCKAFGDVIEVPTPPAKKHKRKPLPQQPEEDITPDYAQKIRHAREHLGLTQKDFALKLNEKESTIHQLESGHLKPSLEQAQKLQKNLNIQLTHTTQPEEAPKINFKNTTLTIGDLIKIKKKH